MRLFAAALVLAALGALASPALAQGRDPFDPQLEEGSGSQAVGGSSGEDPFAPQDPGGGTDPDPAPFDPDVDPDPAPPNPDPDVDPAPQDPDVFPNTGVDPSTWLAAGVALLTMGAGLVTIARVYSPRYVRG